MYYAHFGLDKAPFKITPNTDFFFSGGNRGPILEALIYAVTHGEGIIKVSGEVGSGKTMLCNMLMQRLPHNVETVYLANPSVSPEEILHAIAFELHLELERKASRLEMMQALQAYLLKRHADGKRVVIFVEESQGMPLRHWKKSACCPTWKPKTTSCCKSCCLANLNSMTICASPTSGNCASASRTVSDWRR